MIEKLDKKMEFVEISVFGNKKAECLDFEAGRRLNLKINELVDDVNELQAKDEEIEEWIAIVGDLRKQVRELQMKVKKLASNINFAQPEVKENVLTKSLRMDKEFVEEEMERLQKENSDLKDKLERITDILYESKYALEEIINPSFISHEQEMAQEALDKVNAEIKAITGE